MKNINEITKIIFNYETQNTSNVFITILLSTLIFHLLKFAYNYIISNKVSLKQHFLNKTNKKGINLLNKEEIKLVECFKLNNLNNIEDINSFINSCCNVEYFDKVNNNNNINNDKYYSINIYEFNQLSYKSIINVITKLNHYPNINTYNSLLRYLFTNNNYNDANLLFNELTNGHMPICEINSDTYKVYIHGILDYLLLPMILESEHQDIITNNKRNLLSFTKGSNLFNNNNNNNYNYNSFRHKSNKDKEYVSSIILKLVRDLTLNSKQFNNNIIDKHILDLISVVFFYNIDTSLFNHFYNNRSIANEEDNSSSCILRIILSNISNTKNISEYEKSLYDNLYNISLLLKDYDNVFSEIIYNNLLLLDEYYFNNNITSIGYNNYNNNENYLLNNIVETSCLYYFYKLPNELNNNDSINKLISENYFNNQISTKINNIFGYFKSLDSSNNYKYTICRLMFSRILYIIYYYDSIKESFTKENKKENEHDNEHDNSIKDSKTKDDILKYLNIKQSNKLDVYNNISQYLETNYKDCLYYNSELIYINTIIHNSYSKAETIYKDCLIKHKEFLNNVNINNSKCINNESSKVKSLNYTILFNSIIFSKLHKLKFDLCINSLTFNNNKYNKALSFDFIENNLQKSIVFNDVIKDIEEFNCIINKSNNHIMSNTFKTSTYCLILEGFILSNNNNKAKQIINDLRRVNPFKDSNNKKNIFNSSNEINEEALLLTCLKAYLFNNDCISSVYYLKEIQKKNIKLNSSLYGKIIKMYSSLNSEEKSFDNYSEMISKVNLKPNMSCYLGLSDILIKKNKLTNAYGMFLDIKQGKFIFNYDNLEDISYFKMLVFYFIKNKEINKSFSLLEYYVKNRDLYLIKNNKIVNIFFNSLFEYILEHKNVYNIVDVSLFTKNLIELMNKNNVYIDNSYFTTIGKIISTSSNSNKSMKEADYLSPELEKKNKTNNYIKSINKSNKVYFNSRYKVKKSNIYNNNNNNIIDANNFSNNNSDSNKSICSDYYKFNNKFDDSYYSSNKLLNTNRFNYKKYNANKKNKTEVNTINNQYFNNN